MECGEAVVIDDLYVPYEPAAVRHVLSEAELASVQSRRFIDLLAVSQASRVPVETLVSLHAQRVVKVGEEDGGRRMAHECVFRRQSKTRLHTSARQEPWCNSIGRDRAF